MIKLLVSYEAQQYTSFNKYWTMIVKERMGCRSYDNCCMECT